MAKVYVITAETTGLDLGETLGATFRLEADIQRLAKREGAEIALHRYAQPAPDAPAVLLECTEAFLEKVKALGNFGSVRPLEAGVKTFDRSRGPQVEPPQAGNTIPGP